MTQEEQVIKTYVHMWPNAVQQILKRYDPEIDAAPGAITAAEAALAKLVLELVTRVEALELDRLGLKCRRCTMLDNVRGEMAELEEQLEELEKRGLHDAYLFSSATLNELEVDEARWANRPCTCLEPAEGENKA